MVITLMAKKKSPPQENDGTYFLKLVLYIILGSFWIKFPSPSTLGYFVRNGFPLGLLLGLLFASHDHFQIDSKME